MQTILICDDEKDIRSALRIYLAQDGYRVLEAADGQMALDLISHDTVHLVLLDIMMPVMDGISAMVKIREQSNVPVILLTAKSEDTDKVLGLNVGADDYITKPFDMRELIARAKSLLRRMEPIVEKEEPTKIIIDEVVLHLTNRTAYSNDKLLDLTPKEFDLLALLLSNPGRVYTREQLLDQIWGMDYFGGTRTVDVHMQRIRKKLGRKGSEVLHTIHGVGYKALGGESENKHKN